MTPLEFHRLDRRLPARAGCGRCAPSKVPPAGKHWFWGRAVPGVWGERWWMTSKVSVF